MTRREVLAVGRVQALLEVVIFDQDALLPIPLMSKGKLCSHTIRIHPLPVLQGEDGNGTSCVAAHCDTTQTHGKTKEGAWNPGTKDPSLCNCNMSYKPTNEEHHLL